MGLTLKVTFIIMHTSESSETSMHYFCTYLDHLSMSACVNVCVDVIGWMDGWMGGWMEL